MIKMWLDLRKRFKSYSIPSKIGIVTGVGSFLLACLGIVIALVIFVVQNNGNQDVLETVRQSLNTRGEKSPSLKKVLDVDISLSSFKKHYGEPVLWEDYEKHGTEVSFYLIDGYICVVFNIKNRIVAFQILIIEPRSNFYVFNVKREDLNLGKFSFFNYDENGTGEEHFSSKDGIYIEKYYFGNPGKYRSYILGLYQRSLPIYNELEVSKYKSTDLQYRKVAHPNMYAVISGGLSPEVSSFLLENIYPYFVHVDTLLEMYIQNTRKDNQGRR